MNNQIQSIKETVAGKIDEPEFNWLELSIPQEGIIIHYTPRCKSILLSLIFYRATYGTLCMCYILFWDVEYLSPIQQPLEENDELLDQV